MSSREERIREVFLAAFDRVLSWAEGLVGAQEPETSLAADVDDTEAREAPIWVDPDTEPRPDAKAGECIRAFWLAGQQFGCHGVANHGGRHVHRLVGGELFFD